MTRKHGKQSAARIALKENDSQNYHSLSKVLGHKQTSVGPILNSAGLLVHFAKSICPRVSLVYETALTGQPSLIHQT